MGIKKARAAMALVDHRSESVAESRSRLTFIDHGLPAPETQQNIFDTHGNRIARVDFLWRQYGVIGECDGFGKYFDGADESELRRRLAREKDRDAELLALGYRVLHWRWADIEQPRLLAERVRRVLHPTAA
jgi:very-short-patch-repair endonuclease